MFRDMENSKEYSMYFKQVSDIAQSIFSVQFCDHIADTTGAQPINMEFSVAVLTMGQWPPYDYANITLPPELSSCLETYQQFYATKHTNKKLQWQHSLGDASLDVDCLDGESEKMVDG